jgi:DNA-binding response OmpR family regulator
MRTVLIIEDNPKNARLMRRILEARDWHVLHAEDGESGLQMALAERPDVILLDLGLPDVDGQSVAGMLKMACPTPPLSWSRRGPPSTLAR